MRKNIIAGVISGIIVLVIGAFFIDPVKNLFFSEKENKVTNSPEENSPIVSSDNSEVNITYNIYETKEPIAEDDEATPNKSEEKIKKEHIPISEPDIAVSPKHMITDIVVKVPPHDKDGKPWDKKGPPDLAICFKTPINGETKCSPSMIVGAGVIATMQCKNQYNCKFRNIALKSTTLEIAVINVNWRESQIIGSAECSIFEVCSVGEANVSFDWSNYQ